MSNVEPPLLEFDRVSVDYRQRGRKAVEAVSFSIRAGETVGLVGESGSGKTTIGSTIVGLAPVSSGRILFKGEDITHARPRRRRELSAQLQVIFQDPYSSLNPLRTIEQTLVEPLLVHGRVSARDSRAAVASMLERVGLSASAASRYPGNFSGGQRQRIAIARALMASPELVVCDEAVSALDLSVQAQVLNLLLELQRESNMSYLFVSHDLSVVRHMCDRIVVLYGGKLMEIGDAQQVYDRPAHPYTQALLAASPLPHPAAQARQRERIRIRSRPAMPEALTDACRFADRCALATEVCVTIPPPLESVPGDAAVACHHVESAQLYEAPLRVDRPHENAGIPAPRHR